MRFDPPPLPVVSDPGDHVRAIVAERFRIFAAGCFLPMLVWAVALSHGSRHALVPALVTLALQGATLGVARTAARRDPSRAVGITLTLAMAFGVSSTGLFAWIGGTGESLGFVLFTLCALGALLFPWGWRVELALVLAILGLLGLATPWLHFALGPNELAPVIIIAALLCVAIAEGNAQGFHATLARRRSEEAALHALAASRDGYRDITEDARDFIWASDLEGRITYINEAGARILGMTPAMTIGRNVDQYLTDHPTNPSAAEMRARLRTSDSLPPTVVQWRSIHGRIWVEVVAYAVRSADGDVIGFRGISRDVTARFEAEAALRESEARYRGLVESQAALIYRADLAGNLTFINEACRRKYGVIDEPVTSLNFLSFVHPDEAEPARRALQTVVSGGRYQRASRGRTPEGWRWIEWEVCAITDGDGAVREIQGVGHDVTERRAADEALQRSLCALREREDQLRGMGMQQVAIREEERKRLSFDLHDGVCQELVGIGILIESARRRGISEAADPTLVRAQRHLREVAEHLRVLARDLRPLQLSDLGLAECLRALASGMATAEIHVGVAFPTPIPRLGEELEVAVYRIAQEAVANAVRHADAGMVSLTLSAVEGALLLEVHDDGRGFDRDALRTSALGLVAMEERAAALGGRLRIVSQPGDGTTIRLECPTTAA